MNGMQVTYLFMNNKLKTFHIGIIGRFKEVNSFIDLDNCRNAGLLFWSICGV